MSPEIVLPSTIERLRQLRSEEPALFLDELQRILNACDNPDTRAFWTAVKKLAEQDV